MQIRDVFIIMPFTEQRLVMHGAERTYSTEHLDDVYTLLRDAVAEYDGSINVDRMEQPYGNLVTAIIRRLADADVVIAILAGKNPNVFYELGVRHSLRLNTIMLVEERDEYPFDLTAYFSKQYSIQHERGRRELKAFIKDRLKEIAAGPQSDSPVLDILKAAEFEQLRVVNTWEARRAAMLMDGLLREVRFVNAIFADCIKALDDDKLVTMRLSWNVIDGFTKNRLLPGLPALAYEDAEAVYRAWRELEFEWNDAVHRKKVDNNLLLNLIAMTDRVTIGFWHDLANALDFVMSRRAAYAIPWQGSFDQIGDLVPTTGLLDALRTVLNKRVGELGDRFQEFEKSFVGLPPDLLLTDTSSQFLRLPPLHEFVEEAKKLYASQRPPDNTNKSRTKRRSAQTGDSLQRKGQPTRKKTKTG